MAFAILGVMGAPFFGGNISKYFLMPEMSDPLYWMIALVNLGTIAVFVRFATILFGRSGTETVTQKVHPAQQAAVSILGVFCLVGGIWGVRTIAFLFATELSVSVAGYLVKLLIFAVSFGVALFAVRYLIRDNVPPKVFSRLDFGLRGICVSIGGFFAILLFVVGVLSRG